MTDAANAWYRIASVADSIFYPMGNESGISLSNIMTQILHMILVVVRVRNFKHLVVVRVKMKEAHYPVRCPM